MYTIVVGCGRVGAQLATFLSSAGHDVVIIDRQAKSFRRLGAEFDGLTLTGIGYDERTLKRAGIERADALASVTELDNTNLMIAEVAHRIYGVPRVIARLYNPDREGTYAKLDVEYITGTALLARKFYDRLTQPDVIVHHNIDLETQIVEFTFAREHPERKVEDLAVPGEFQVISVVHGGTVYVAERNTPVEPGDRVLAVAKKHILTKLEHLWGKP